MGGHPNQVIMQMETGMQRSKVFAENWGVGALGNVGFGAKYQQGRELQELGRQEGGG